MNEETVNQSKKQYPWLKSWKKGQSGNPKGRPKGKTLKEWAKERLYEMADDDKAAFLETLPTEIVWKMAEGNPETKQDIKIDTNSSYTEEQLEAAKKLLLNGQPDTTSNRPPEHSSGTKAVQQ